MELNHNNPNGEIVLARKFNFVKQFVWKIVIIALKNEYYKLFS